MRQKRAKLYKKCMAMHCLSFGFRQPYQVLVDSEICLTATALGMDFVKQLAITLQGEVKPMITQCCIVELYKMGPSKQPAVDLAKSFERRKCNHKEAIEGVDCVKSVVGETNKHRYVVATQVKDLRYWLRKVPGVPILLLDRSVMVLEAASEATLRAKKLAEEKSMSGPGASAEKEEVPKKKIRGPKQPNPLSMKKKKPRQEPPPPKKKADAETGQKRKREETTTTTEGVDRKRRKAGE
ncbi:Fcf1-domain-containing protein [Sistotremastrum niveocremeum HHB9708]|uniref:U three protein 23 n=1 Tax=Sistotremastrum niveocremeum HHB9708 TaxID=1314777 RepID=A0A164UCZ3_9AGAM|nr:Fcf1-domain-containing protein [Sistotremastrum niveocremeum HHB9708]